MTYMICRTYSCFEIWIYSNKNLNDMRIQNRSDLIEVKFPLIEKLLLKLIHKKYDSDIVYVKVEIHQWLSNRIFKGTSKSNCIERLYIKSPKNYSEIERSSMSAFLVKNLNNIYFALSITGNRNVSAVEICFRNTIETEFNFDLDWVHLIISNLNLISIEEK